MSDYSNDHVPVIEYLEFLNKLLQLKQDEIQETVKIQQRRYEEYITKWKGLYKYLLEYEYQYEDRYYVNEVNAFVTSIHLEIKRCKHHLQNRISFIRPKVVLYHMYLNNTY